MMEMSVFWWRRYVQATADVCRAPDWARAENHGWTTGKSLRRQEASGSAVYPLTRTHTLARTRTVVCTVDADG